jgi:hypothetical protein
VTDALFDWEPNLLLAGDGESRANTAGARQLAMLNRGWHPLSVPTGKQLPLHPDAPDAANRDAAGPRCGNCWFRRTSTRPGRNPRNRCIKGTIEDPTTVPSAAARASSTQVPAWWPACHHYTPQCSPPSPLTTTLRSPH